MVRGGKREPAGGRPKREDGPTQVVGARLTVAEVAALSVRAEAAGLSNAALAAAVLRAYLAGPHQTDDSERHTT